MIGAEFVRDIEHGEMVVIDEDGAQSHKPFPPMTPRPCIFEYIYFARPDSIVDGRHVYEVRKTMGAELAREAPAAADVVVPVPDSGVPAAIGFAPGVGHSLRDSASSAITMSAAPSSSRRRRSAIWACA